MRVLQVIDKSFVGGGQNVVRNLLDGLRGTGVEAILACRDGGPLVTAAAALGTSVHAIPFDKRFRPGPARAVAALSRAAHVDVVHAHGLVATSYCTAARTLFGMRRPLIYHQHGFHHHNYGAGTQGLRKRIEKAVCRRADRVVAASQADFDALLSEGYVSPARLERIDYGLPDRAPPPHEIVAARRAARIPNGAPVVGLIARLHQQKGVDVFLRAAATVHAAVPDAVFLIVGSGELEHELRQLHESLGLGDAVRWMGSQPSASYAALFTVAVLSSRWEGMPLMILEYMGLSRPIVTTALPACIDAVHGTASVVPPDDPAAMAEAIVLLLKCSDRAKALGTAARAEFARRFTVDRMVERVCRMYDEVTS